MPKYQKFLSFWFINAILLYLFQMLFPTQFTIGNSILESYQAVAITSFVWNYILWHAMDELEGLDIKLEGAVNVAVIYLVLNFSVVWLIARYSILSGIGIGSYQYVFLLALAANVVQYFAWNYFKSKE